MSANINARVKARKAGKQNKDVGESALGISTSSQTRRAIARRTSGLNKDLIVYRNTLGGIGRYRSQFSTSADGCQKENKQEEEDFTFTIITGKRGLGFGNAHLTEVTEIKRNNFGKILEESVFTQMLPTQSDILSVIIGNIITTISNETFKDAYHMHTVTFNPVSQVKTIGESAFSNCSSLPKIDFPSSLTTISDNAFINCSRLRKIVFIKNLESLSLGSDSFTGIANNVNDGDDYGNRPIDLLTPNNSLFSIGFVNQQLIISSNNSEPSRLEFFKATDGSGIYIFNNDINNHDDITIGDWNNYNILAFGNNLIICYDNTTTSTSLVITNPSKNKFIKRVLRTTSNSLTFTAPNSEFGTLTSIHIGDQYTSIDSNAFLDMRDLTQVTFGNNSSLTSIGASAFNNTGITRIEIPEKVTNISANAFKNSNNLYHITFLGDPNNIIFGDKAFFDISHSLMVVYDKYTFTNEAFKIIFNATKVDYIPLYNATFSLQRSDDDNEILVLLNNNITDISGGIGSIEFEIKGLSNIDASDISIDPTLDTIAQSFSTASGATPFNYTLTVEARPRRGSKKITILQPAQTTTTTAIGVGYLIQFTGLTFPNDYMRPFGQNSLGQDNSGVLLRINAEKIAPNTRISFDRDSSMFTKYSGDVDAGPTSTYRNTNSENIFNIPNEVSLGDELIYIPFYRDVPHLRVFGYDKQLTIVLPSIHKLNSHLSYSLIGNERGIQGTIIIDLDGNLDQSITPPGNNINGEENNDGILVKYNGTSKITLGKSDDTELTFRANENTPAVYHIFDNVPEDKTIPTVKKVTWSNPILANPGSDGQTAQLSYNSDQNQEYVQLITLN